MSRSIYRRLCLAERIDCRTLSIADKTPLGGMFILKPLNVVEDIFLPSRFGPFPVFRSLACSWTYHHIYDNLKRKKEMDRRGIEPRAGGCKDLRVNHHHGPFLGFRLAAHRVWPPNLIPMDDYWF